MTVNICIIHMYNKCCFIKNIKTNNPIKKLYTTYFIYNCQFHFYNINSNCNNMYKTGKNMLRKYKYDIHERKM